VIRTRHGTLPICSPEVLGGLPGEMAIGHTRYATAGDGMLNAQPFTVNCTKGRIAVAHTAISPTRGTPPRTGREGSIFQANSDTEVILHLVARSRKDATGSATRSLLQLEGAFL
jgi:amidophosphoribosyltransferase